MDFPLGVSSFMESRVGPDMTEVKPYLYPHNYLSQSVA